MLKMANKRCKRNFHILKVKYAKRKDISIDNLIDDLDINKNTKNVSKLLLKQSYYYNNHDKTFAQCLYYKSAATYKYLKNTLQLKLPSVSSIYKWSPIKFIPPGVNEVLMEQHNSFFLNKPSVSRICVLSFDEISIKQDLTHNILLDRIDGFYDDGHERKNKLATSALFFMVRSVIDDWKYVINYVLIDKSFTAQNLSDMIKENIALCEEKMNLNIVMLTCDQGTINIQTYKNLGVTPEKPYFEFGNKIIFCQHDPPHLLKSARNAFVSNQISHSQNETADINVIRKIFERDTIQQCKILPKLTRKHLYPNTFERMNVSLAAQLLSNTVCSAIRTAEQTCPEIFGTYIDNVMATAKLVERFNNIFDCLNCRNFSSKSPYEKPLRLNNDIYIYLEDSLEFLQTLKVCKNENYFKFVKGLQITIKAQLLLINYLKQNYAVEYILVGKTNQDALENFFSKLRAKGGFNYMPSGYEIGVHYANVTVIKLLFNSEYSNCKTDDGTMVELEWSTFQEDYKTSLKNSESVYESLAGECDIICNTENDVLKRNAIAYYAGFCALKKINCNECRIKLLKDDEEITSVAETFIMEKNFFKSSNYGPLKAPTAEYAEVACALLKIFEQTFIKDCHLPNICSTLTETCLSVVERDFPGFLSSQDNVCYDHIKCLIHFFILVLARKNSKWSVLKGTFKNSKNRSASTQASRRINILNN